MSRKFHDSKLAVAIRLIAFWTGLAAMFALFIILVNDDLKIAQREIILKVDVKNKINICLAEDDEIFQESFFGF